jgi:hypothetical protein
MNNQSLHDRTSFWFPAKRRGWGWGLPQTWQGRLVLALFYLAILFGAWWLLPTRGPGYFVAYSIALCALLIAICWLKGEPTRWRNKSD